MSLSEDRKLSANSLRRPANLKALGFRTTKGLDQLSGLIGQERAVRSVNFGLSVQSKGYNIFMVGEPGRPRAHHLRDERA